MIKGTTMAEIDIRFAERITKLETQMETFQETQKEINKKLDDILRLKNQGQGVFWAASAIFGVVLSLAGSFFFDYFRGM